MIKGKASQDAVTIQTTDSAFIPYQPTRMGLIIQAPLTNRVTLGFGVAAVLDAGITLYPGGAPLVLSGELHAAIVVGPIRAISFTAPQVLAYVEAEDDDHSVGVG